VSAQESDGWSTSAAAWIKGLGNEGDFGRRYVLDSPMTERIKAQSFRTALDVGCGEGRFCRIMQAHGLQTVGIDPTEVLIQWARQLDPKGDYRIGRAETLDVAIGSFDLVVGYLTLSEFPDLAPAITNIVAALRPGGTLLIAKFHGSKSGSGRSRSSSREHVAQMYTSPASERGRQAKLAG
jgi:2-polyprenyl-3-methyl-5-hydroxy-6-metoxy-1,4-benzoquinol methylase